MSHAPLTATLRRAATAGLAAALCAPLIAVPSAPAAAGETVESERVATFDADEPDADEQDLGNAADGGAAQPAGGAGKTSSEAVANGEKATAPEGPAKLTRSYLEGGKLAVQVVGDVLGDKSRTVGLGVGDLGTMTPLGNGEFAMVFGDSFTGPGFGIGEWLSPVGVVATRDARGAITIKRPLNSGSRVRQLVNYSHTDGLTLLPSDVINIDGTLYMQGMWSYNLSANSTQVFRSTDNGQSWQAASGKYRSPFRTANGGINDLLSWEMGGDGYLYAVTTSFSRKDPVFLWRAQPGDIADQSKWEMYNTNTRSWGSSGTSILDRNPGGSPVKAGELNLRYIDGYWLLAMFNESTAAVEVRVSDTLERDWNTVPVATVASNGPWAAPQTPANWTQLYGGYIVPGSRLNNLDLVISQWNTTTNDRYMATQFNVRGLAAFTDNYSADNAPATNKQVYSRSTTTRPGGSNTATSNPGSGATSGGSGSSGGAGVLVVAILLGLVAAVGILAANYWPALLGAVSPQLRGALPF